MLGFSSSLVAMLKISQSQLDVIVKSQKERADRARTAHLKQIEMEQRCIDEMLHTYRETETNRGVDVMQEGSESGIVQKRQSLRVKQLQIEKDIANLHITVDKRQNDLDILKKEEHFQRALANDKRRTKKLIEESKRTTVDDLTYAVLKYKALGLDFLKTGQNSLRFQFTQIDTANPDRAFTFTLNVNDSDLYEVEECDPPLKANVIMTLLEALNSSENLELFSGFIHGMRKAFQSSISLQRSRVLKNSSRS